MPLHITPLIMLWLLLSLQTVVSYASNNAEEHFSLVLKRAPLVSTLHYLAQQQDINLVIDDKLEGNINLNLNDTNFDHVLQAIGKIHRLHIEKFEGNYFIRSTDNISSNPTKSSTMTTKMKTQQTALLANSQLTTVKIPLHYAKASELIQTLNGNHGSLLSTEGKITFDEYSNNLIIKEHPNTLANLRQIIQQLDQPTRQVLIEARIVTISDESMRELGSRWGLFDPTDRIQHIGGKLEANGFNTLTDHLNVNFASEYANAASISLHITKLSSRLLDLELTALERENNVNIIASPRLLTTNQQRASIKQGTEIPYLINNSKNETQSVEFREAVLGLEVTPHISQNNTILLDLLISQNSPGSSVSYGNQQLTTIDKQEIQTQVLARHGETIVLGGVFHDTRVDGQDKVPLLGDIPIIKHLFSKDSQRHTKRELVIFVTPYITNPQQKQAITLQNHPMKKQHPFIYGF